jgi:hypothetical protein
VGTGHRTISRASHRRHRRLPLKAPLTHATSCRTTYERLSCSVIWNLLQVPISQLQGHSRVTARSPHQVRRWIQVLGVGRHDRSLVSGTGQSRSPSSYMGIRRTSLSRAKGALPSP